MVGKNNQYLKKTKEGTKVETYSIKKFKVGTASVVIGASIFFGAGAACQRSKQGGNEKEVFHVWRVSRLMGGYGMDFHPSRKYQYDYSLL